MRDACARGLDLVDDVARAWVADALVLRIVGDELRVAAVRAVERAPDRPPGLFAFAFVLDVVFCPPLYASFAVVFDYLSLSFFPLLLALLLLVLLLLP